MLEDRLSNTYSQHSIGGYNLPQQQQNMYPSIPTNLPAGPGGAESFYTGNAPPQIEQRGPYDQHGRTPYGQQAPQQYSGYGQAPPAMQHAYPNLDHRQENHTPYQPQRTGSYSQQTPGPSSNYAPSQPQQNFNKSEPSMTPSADPNAAFYYGTGPPAQQQQQQQQQAQQYQPGPAPSAPPGPSDPAQDYYASSQASIEQTQHPDRQYTVSPMTEPSQMDQSRYQNIQSPQPPQHFVSQAHSPEQSQRQPVAQQAPQQPQAGYQYWQQQQEQNTQQYAPQQQSWQAPAPQPSFIAPAFPTAPQHTPQTKQQVAVEEPLIEF